MSDQNPIWLPPMLKLPEGYSERLEFLKEKYNELIISAPLETEGETVHLNTRIFVEGMHEAFWHLVGKGENRSIDVERACRMPWFRPLLEHPDDPAVLRWDGEGTKEKQICRHLWLNDYDYFVLLAPGRKDGKFLVTAHYVEGRRRRRDLLQRYRRAQLSI